MVKYAQECSQVGVKSIGTVYQTSDYTLFKKMKGNRPVSKNNTLKRELQEMGQLSPIVVNGRYEVIDGQHRLGTLKELGLPVNFVIAQTTSPRTVISMNSAQKNWKDADYLAFFVANGNSEYIRLNQIYNQYKDYVSLTVLYRNIVGDVLGEKFRSGLLTIKDEVKVLSTCAFLKEFALETEYGFMQSHFQVGLVRLLAIEGFNRERFIKKFIHLGMAEKKHLFRNREANFERFVVEIYNHGLKESSPLYIPYRYTKTKTIEIISRDEM